MKILKDSIINENLKEKIIDSYTILDIEESASYFEEDYVLSSNFSGILATLKTNIKNMIEIDIEKELSYKITQKIKKKKLYKLYNMIMENLQKKICQINHFIQTISNKIDSMKENFFDCVKLCNKLKEEMPDLNVDLIKFFEAEKEFNECRKQNLKNIEQSNNTNKIEREKVLKSYFGIIENKYVDYLKIWKEINEKIKPYCEKQNLVFEQSGKALPSFLYDLKVLKFMNIEQKEHYEKNLLYEEENIKDIYSKAKKTQEVPCFKWEELINKRIEKVTTKEYLELTTDIISYLIKDESLKNTLVKRNRLWYDIYLIFFENNKNEKKRKLSDALKNISDKKELLFFLNHNRAKLKNLSKDFFKEVTNIMKELQAYFVLEQDYESSNLLFTMVQTYYYINKKGKKNIFQVKLIMMIHLKIKIF